MNSDFGADIFDEEPARPAPPPAATSTRSEPARSHEIELQTRDAASAPVDDVSFGDSTSRERQEPARRPRDDARPPRPERGRDETRERERGSRRGGRAEEREAAPHTSEQPAARREERRGEEHGRRDAKPWRQNERNSRDEARGQDQRRRPAAERETTTPADAEARPAWQRGGRDERRRPRREGRDERRREPRWPQQPPPAEGGAARHAAGTPTPATPAQEVTAATRVAVLLDLEDLQQQARQRGCQISYGRVLRTLAGDRPVVRAVAYTTPADQNLAASLTAHGIEVVDCDDPEGALVSITLDAMALATRVDALVVASNARGLSPLAQALRALGVRVESATLEPAAAWNAQGHLQISRECLFVP